MIVRGETADERIKPFWHLMTMARESDAQSEFDADIKLFEEMFSAKARFFDQIVEGRDANSEVEVRDLRQENIYEIAEFYYLLKMFKIDTPSKLRKFGESHNSNIVELLQNKHELDKLGVQPQRLREAMFDTVEKLDRLEANCGDKTIWMSQSDLARFLVEYMSFESCRRSIKILSDAGYLTLSKSPFGSILVSSNAKLETIFGRYIRSFRNGIMNVLSI
jgi:hypothetical protein